MISACVGRATPPGPPLPLRPRSRRREELQRTAALQLLPPESDHRKDDRELGFVDGHDRRKRNRSVRAAGQVREAVARCAAEALWCRLCRRIEMRMGWRLGRPHRRPPSFRCTYPNHFVRDKSASPRPAHRSDSHRSKCRSRVVERPVPALCLLRPCARWQAH
jgi:hypothetical protein